MTETMTLDEQIQELRRQKREQKAIEEQKRMLPALSKRFKELVDRQDAAHCQSNAVKAAIEDIEAGKLTSYRLRAKPVRKAKALKAGQVG
jgi:hypothetical protein